MLSKDSEKGKLNKRSMAAIKNKFSLKKAAMCLPSFIDSILVAQRKRKEKIIPNLITKQVL